MVKIPNEKLVIQKILYGEKDYFKIIVEHLENLTIGIISNMLKARQIPKHLTEDILQEHWIRLYKCIINKKFDPKKGTISSFSYSLIPKVFFDYLRRRANRFFTSLEFIDENGDYKPKYYLVSPENPLVFSMYKHICQEIYKTLDRLPEKLKTFLVLKYIANIDEKELSRINNITLSALRSHISRATRDFFKLFKKYTPYGKLISDVKSLFQILKQGFLIPEKGIVKTIKDKKIKLFISTLLEEKDYKKALKKTGIKKKEEKEFLASCVEILITHLKRRKKKAKLSQEEQIEFILNFAKEFVLNTSIFEITTPSQIILKKISKKHLTFSELQKKLKTDEITLIKLLNDKIDFKKSTSLLNKLEHTLNIPSSKLIELQNKSKEFFLNTRNIKETHEILKNAREKAFKKIGINF